MVFIHVFTIKLRYKPICFFSFYLVIATNIDCFISRFLCILQKFFLESISYISIHILDQHCAVGVYANRILVHYYFLFSNFLFIYKEQQQQLLQQYKPKRICVLFSFCHHQTHTSL